MIQIFSPNMLKTYEKCPKKLYFRYIEGINVPLSFLPFEKGKELLLSEYEKFSFTYLDKTERYNENGEEYGKTKSYKFNNDGINLSGCEVYVLYNNFNNNEIDSYNVDIFKIK